MALALAAGGTLAEAARLANEAAGVAVGKFGAATVTPQELRRQLKDLQGRLAAHEAEALASRAEASASSWSRRCATGSSA